VERHENEHVMNHKDQKGRILEVNWQQTKKKEAWFGVQGWVTAWRYVQNPSAAFVMNKSSLHDVR